MKIHPLLIAAAMLMSCSKNNDTVQPRSKTSTSLTAGKNEMVELMDKMMDDMHSGKSTGNVDADFAKMMIAHHKGAVEMSELLLKKGKDQQMLKLAEDIKSAQQPEIGEMQKHINADEQNSTPEFQQALHGSMSSMMSNKSADYGNIDLDFAAQMIPHHQSAVDMANVYLKYGKTAGLLELCKNIVTTQTAEIKQMQQWLNHQTGK